MALLVLFMLGVGVALMPISIGLMVGAQQRMVDELKRNGHFARLFRSINFTMLSRTPGSPSTTSPEAARASQQFRAGVYVGLISVALVVGATRFMPAGALPWSRPMTKADVMGVVALLAFAGAAASWVVGAIYFAFAANAMGNGWSKFTAVVWPFFVGRIKGMPGENAANVNKALVAFLTCMLVAFASYSISTNLHRFAK